MQSPNANDQDVVVSMRGITKRFPGVTALDNVTLEIRRGEVLALAGENGAGKSTLMKVLSGLYHPDEGEVYINSKKEDIHNTKRAQELGISTIWQEPSLAPHLNAVQNIYLGRELTIPILGKAVRLLDEGKMLKNTKEMYSKFFDTLDDVTVPVAHLGALKNRVVEIVKAVSIDCQVLIMDEPTAALAEGERRVLFQFVRQLKEKGISIIYITHHLREIFEISDRIVVLRDGTLIDVMNTKDTNEEELVSKMVGRTIKNYIVKNDVEISDKVLEVKGLTNKNIKNISLYVRKGEIVGLSGLAGSGRTETVRAIFGADPHTSGKIFVDGREVGITSPNQAIKYGIGLLPENRKIQGAVLSMSVKENISLANLSDVLKGNMAFDFEKEKAIAEKFCKKVRVKTPTINTSVNSLSGGNQQKVILAKWLFTNPKVLIFDEPTQGIDVGAKQEIYELISEFVKAGGSILIVSSELPEMLGLADRVYVMHEGEIVHEFSREEATEESITYYASGGVDK